MINAKIEKNQRAEIRATGTTAEIANDALNILSAIYANFCQSDKMEAIIFRTYIMTALNDPHSPVWDGMLPEGSISMGVHKKVKREDGKK